jgi:hypothetical protein
MSRAALEGGLCGRCVAVCLSFARPRSLGLSSPTHCRLGFPARSFRRRARGGDVGVPFLSCQAPVSEIWTSIQYSRRRRKGFSCGRKAFCSATLCSGSSCDGGKISRRPIKPANRGSCHPAVRHILRSVQPGSQGNKGSADAADLGQCRSREPSGTSRFGILLAVGPASLMCRRRSAVGIAPPIIAAQRPSVAAGWRSTDRLRRQAPLPFRTAASSAARARWGQLP